MRIISFGIYPHSHPHLYHAISIYIHVIIAVYKCIYYPISAYEVMSSLDFGVVILSCSKHRKALSIVEHYYLYHSTANYVATT
jgi:hypothetical protein